MENFVIENSVLKKYIGNDSYVTIPDGITEIADCAFEKCDLLKQIAIPKSVACIGDYAFWGCSSLQQITIPVGVTVVKSAVFFNCTSLKQVTIPDTVTEIANSAFEKCDLLNQITIPNSVACIGDYAFCDASSLQQVIVPNSVVNIGRGAFCGCNLKTSKSCYKAFKLNGNNQLQCMDYIFNEKQEPQHIENIKVCFTGYHYCTNLFEIFDYYKGELDVDIAIYKIKPIGKILKEENSSKCCCQSFKFKKRLYREDIIKILNGGE